MSKLFKFCFILFAGSCISQDKDLGSRGMGISKKITGSSSGVEYYDEIIDDDEDSEEEKAQIRRHLQSDSETLQDEIKAVLRDKSLLRKSLSDDEVSSQEFLDEIADLKLQDDYADHIESDNELERKKKELRKLKKMKALRQSMLKKFKPFPINKFNKFSDSNSDELDEENNIIDVFCRGLKKRAKNSLTIAKLRVELCR